MEGGGTNKFNLRKLYRPINFNVNNFCTLLYPPELMIGYYWLLI